MSYDPSLDDPATYTPPPPPRRGGLAIVFIAAGVVALVLVGVIFYVGGVIPHGGVSKESAQRACRTAFGNEWKVRQAQTAAGSDVSIIASVNNVELQETWEAKDGWSVNSTVHYTLTTALIAPVQGSIDLTCTATGDDDSPSTTVTNRG